MDPLIPKPWIIFIALVLVGFLGLNLWLDYSSLDYSGATFTYAICSLIASMLGLPIGIAAWRKQREDPATDRRGDQP